MGGEETWNSKMKTGQVVFSVDQCGHPKQNSLGERDILAHPVLGQRIHVVSLS